MDGSKIKIHGGRISADNEETSKSVSGISNEAPTAAEAPVRSHAPGQTFQPQPTKAETDEPPTPKPTESAPVSTTVNPSYHTPTPDVDTQATPDHRKPEQLHISTPTRSWLKYIVKTLKWFGAALLIVLAGALAAIYFYQI